MDTGTRIGGKCSDTHLSLQEPPRVGCRYHVSPSAASLHGPFVGFLTSAIIYSIPASSPASILGALVTFSLDEALRNTPSYQVDRIMTECMVTALVKLHAASFVSASTSGLLQRAPSELRRHAAHGGLHHLRRHPLSRNCFLEPQSASELFKPSNGALGRPSCFFEGDGRLKGTRLQVRIKGEFAFIRGRRIPSRQWTSPRNIGENPVVRYELRSGFSKIEQFSSLKHSQWRGCCRPWPPCALLW